MIYNLQTNALAIIMLLMILFSSRYSSVSLPENNSFQLLLVHLMLLLLLDSGTWIFNMQFFAGARFIHLLFNYTYYAEQAVMGYLWGVYSSQLTHIQYTSKGRWLHRIPMIVALILLAANPITQDVFVISIDNEYSRGWGVGGIIYTICAFYYLIEAITLTTCNLLHSSNQERHNNWSLLVSSVLPIAGSTLQLIWFGVTTIWSFGALGLLLLHLNVQIRRTAEAERELEKSRTAVMLSQIQPHFLYNALTGIKELCNADPEKAQDAMEHFSYFLRGNLDSLADQRLIPLDKEIKHVKDYFYLEKMRFKDRVNLSLEIDYHDVFLPPLTLQPLVENAVRYGIMKKNGGGTVWIHSEKIRNEVVITVRDDGVGFDVSADRDDGITHTGIENVRKRLELQCKATMEIQSKKGRGTNIRITLPLEEVFDEDYSG